MKSIILLFAFFSGFGSFVEELETTKLNPEQIQILSTEKVEFISAEILEDSRCPIGVNCIWEGQVKTSIVLRINDEDPIEYVLSTSPRGGGPAINTDEGYRIKLLDVNPPKDIQKQGIAAAYFLTLKVESNKY